MPFDNNIETYGNATMPDSEYGGITWLRLEEEQYCYVGDLVGNPELSAGVAGFSTEDNYSFEVFPLEDYSGLVAVHAVSKLNMVDYYSLYASDDAESIPAKLVEDFPHEDTWLDDDQITEIDGVSYCVYGSTDSDFEVGEKLFEYEGRSYFSVPRHSEWVAVENEVDKGRYDLYYDTEMVSYLPVDLLFEVNDFSDKACQTYCTLIHPFQP